MPESLLDADTDTTVPSYWLNWRFLLCAIWILIVMLVAALMIWRKEGFKSKKLENGREGAGCLYDDEVWGTCSKPVHPYWLLAFRLASFVAMVVLIVVDVLDRGGGLFYFYTQWTFTLVAIYFGLASALSIHGCLSRRHEVDPLTTSRDGMDIEHGSCVPSTENQDLRSKTGNSSCLDQDNSRRTPASAWGYTLQILFQVSAGATVLTDSVFWLVLYPFLSPSWYQLTYMIVCKHAINAVFLLGDASLSRLRFPFFRVAYFVLFTLLFVVVQWIGHAFVSLRWPYPFMDLAAPLAPAWYVGIAVLHLPCFAVFSLIYWVKNRISSR